MNEELLTIGKQNPHVSPKLDIWGWPIAVYLFLGGLAAGILFFASYFFLRGKKEEYESTIKWAPFVAPPALIIGLLLLLIDLHAISHAFRLFLTINFDSPMSWGAWTLLVITPLSILWIFPYAVERFPKLIKQTAEIELIIQLIEKNRKAIAWVLIGLSVILGIYTGILLSAFNARPLWNTSILGVLFLVSGFSTGVVMIMLFSNRVNEQKTLRSIDVTLIILELFLITHLMMGMLAGPEAQVQSAMMFLGGPYTWPFWSLVVGLGLVIPLLIEIQEMRGKHIPRYLAPILILVGGLLFRLIMVYAGQASSFANLIGG